MVKSALVPLMLLAAVLSSNLGCESPSEPEPQPSSAALSSGLATPLASQNEATSPGLPALSEGDAIKQATKVSDALLTLLDQGKYGESWEQNSKLFKDRFPKDAWCKQIAAIRLSMGPVLSRTMKQTDYKTKIAEAPAGQYVIIHYETAFKNADRGIEEITAMREKDGTWRTFGYYLTIRPEPRGTPSR